MSVGTTTGVAPTTAVVSYRENDTQIRDLPPGRYSDFVTSKVRGSEPIWEVILAPASSYELQLSVSPWGRCELGALASLLRLGGELRCGLLPGELGRIEAAFSIGVARQIILEPVGTEFRAGLDLSLGRGKAVPLLDVYVGHVPWSRKVAYPVTRPQGWGGYGTVESNRTEWRLSLPVGVAFRGPPQIKGPNGSIVVAIVPEITLASRAFAPAVTYPRHPIVDIDQRWALFLVVRAEGEWQ